MLGGQEKQMGVSSMTQGPADGDLRGHFSPTFPLITMETEVQAGEVISTKVVSPGREGGFFAFCLHSSV